jgi:hypothetical protein
MTSCAQRGSDDASDPTSSQRCDLAANTHRDVVRQVRPLSRSPRVTHPAAGAPTAGVARTTAPTRTALHARAPHARIPICTSRLSPAIRSMHVSTFHVHVGPDSARRKARGCDPPLFCSRRRTGVRMPDTVRPAATRYVRASVTATSGAPASRVAVRIFP